MSEQAEEVSFTLGWRSGMMVLFVFLPETFEVVCRRFLLLKQKPQTQQIRNGRNRRFAEPLELDFISANNVSSVMKLSRV